MVVKTKTQYDYDVDRFMEAGFTRHEAEWISKEGVTPGDDTGVVLIAHRRMNVDLYIEEGYTFREAVRLASADLAEHNRKKGNPEDWVWSEVNLVL